jgi:NAD(P)-dependent dehydrogenase (short-subunit alcohol dehydrogenase family)
LITGCSSGIGRATAELLAAQGELVYATARRLESISELETRGCKLLQLDVTDETTMKEAVAEIESEHGSVGILVNNAGFGLHGAAEETPLEDVRSQFETNFFGLVRLTQLVLPAMRRQRWGRIVNVSSMGGKITFPGGAYYHSTKHALEAFSDALRFELRPFGVDVIVVEPGLIKTRFGEVSVQTVNDTETGPYASFNRALQSRISDAYDGVIGRFAVGPEVVAKTIAKAAKSRSPRARYLVPSKIAALLIMKRLLPDRAFDALLRTAYRPPEP